MFSIIIPLYNKAHTIESTIHSVLNQSFTDFEILIINDGSTDDSVDKVLKTTNDIRLKIINQDNQGVSVARNRGIIEAQHEFIAFLDGDDEWLPTYLEKTVESIKLFPNSGLFLCGRYSQNYETNHRKSYIPKKFENKVEIINFYHNPHIFFHISSTVIRKELIINKIDKWGGFVTGQRYNEDFTFIFRVALYTQTVYTGYLLTIYNGNVKGQATSSLSKSIRLKDVVLFHKLAINEWCSLKKNNTSFKVFMKYETRHLILSYLKDKDSISLITFLTETKPEIQCLLTKNEINFHISSCLNLIKIGYIYFTKLLWRLHFYPVVK